jgi:hypothetical protein
MVNKSAFYRTDQHINTNKLSVTEVGQRPGWFSRRYLDILGSIYIYNEHRGYTALDGLLEGVRQSPRHRDLAAAIEKHAADERKHYLMFQHWYETRLQMPLLVDRACGHIDRFVEIMFRTGIDDIDVNAVLADDRLFERLCRVISLTERRGYRQVEILLSHPIVNQDAGLMKIFRVIKRDEPSHWEPYERWLAENGRRAPNWWERLIDGFIHSELLFLKLPILFLYVGLRRRESWPDAHGSLARGGQRATEAPMAQASTAAETALMTKAAAADMSFAVPTEGSAAG